MPHGFRHITSFMDASSVWNSMTQQIMEISVTESVYFLVPINGLLMASMLGSYGSPSWSDFSASSSFSAVSGGSSLRELSVNNDNSSQVTHHLGAYLVMTHSKICHYVLPHEHYKANLIMYKTFVHITTETTIYAISILTLYFNWCIRIVIRSSMCMYIYAVH